MVDHHEKILREYREADFHRRLHIYLEHPPLRRQFGEIDRRELNLKRRAGANAREVKPRGLFCSIVGCVRRLFNGVSSVFRQSGDALVRQSWRHPFAGKTFS